MLYALAAMLLCQLAGEAFVRALAVPVPGPVVGMILLASLLMLKVPLPSGLGGTADGLLKNLSHSCRPEWAWCSNSIASAAKRSA